ncbi:MAG: hypothetical protein AAFR38_04470 [Planctomycetota bacterium]
MSSELPPTEDLRERRRLDRVGFISWACITLALTLVFVGLVLTIAGFPEDTDEALGEAAAHGEYVGGYIGAAANLGGVLLFFAALWLQREELKAQRSELVAQRLIAGRQEETLRRRTEILEKNEIIDRFFDLANRRLEAIDRVNEMMDEAESGVVEVTKADQSARRLQYFRRYEIASALDKLASELLDRDAIAEEEKQWFRIAGGLHNTPLPAGPHEVTFKNTE